MVRSWLVKAAAVTLSLALLAGCGGTKSGGDNTGADTEDKFVVGMATDVGGLNDDSFNAAAYRGILRAEEELGTDKIVIESKRQEDYETNFQTLIDQGADLVWGIGFMMQAAMNDMAQKNPDQKFAIIDETVNQPNVASVLFKEEEGSFLMGVIAGRSTKTGKVGFVGGMESPVIGRFEAGYRAGVKAVNPDAEVIVVYSASFTDPAKGKSDALTIYGQGADIIFHAAGATGQGVIEAAKEKNLYAIGVDSDQNHLAPNNVITSMIKRVDVAVYDIIKKTVEGNFPGGETVVLDLKDNGVGYADSTLWNILPEGLQAEVDNWAAAIRDGKFTVPSEPGQVDGWTAPTL